MFAAAVVEMPSGSVGGADASKGMIASGYWGMVALTRIAWPAPVPAPEHATDAPGSCTARAAFRAFCNCDARPATVCGTGAPCAKTVTVMGSGAGAVVGLVTLKGTVNAAVAVDPITVAVVLDDTVPVYAVVNVSSVS